MREWDVFQFSRTYRVLNTKKKTFYVHYYKNYFFVMVIYPWIMDLYNYDFFTIQNNSFFSHGTGNHKTHQVITNFS